MKIEHRIPVELHFCLVTEIEVNHLAMQVESCVPGQYRVLSLVYSYPGMRKKEIP